MIKGINSFVLIDHYHYTVITEARGLQQKFFCRKKGRVIRAKMYTQVKAKVPEKYHQRIKTAMTRDRPLAIKLDLTTEGNDIMLLTPGQMIKIHKAMAGGKKVITLRFSKKQVRANTKFEGGFLSMLMKLATKALPTLLSGLATGVISSGVEKAIAGNGLFLGRRGWGTAKVELNGSGIVLTPVEDEDVHGLYFKNDGQIFQGKGLLFGDDSPFKDIPILGLLL